MPIRKKFQNRRAPYRGRPKNGKRMYTAERAPRGPQGDYAEGCVKIVIGKNRARIWNNCGGEITINDTLQLYVTNIYVQRLSGGGKALVVFADVAEDAEYEGGARGAHGGGTEGGDVGDIPDDIEKWI